MRVLIVEDYADSATMLAHLVKQCGHEPLIARDGFEALDAVIDRFPDLILMDIQMPGMNGYEAAKKLREEARLANTPVYAISAFQRDPDREVAAGMQGHFSKPLDIDALTQLLMTAF